MFGKILNLGNDSLKFLLGDIDSCSFHTQYTSMGISKLYAVTRKPVQLLEIRSTVMTLFKKIFQFGLKQLCRRTTLNLIIQYLNYLNY